MVRRTTSVKGHRRRSSIVDLKPGRGKKMGRRKGSTVDRHKRRI